MKINIIDNGFDKHAEMLKRNIAERICADFNGDGLSVALSVNKLIGKEESYRISKNGESYRIEGADESGLFYGIGKFLHTSKWSDSDFIPNPPFGAITPDSSFRAVYFAMHLFNWYASAPAEELNKYLEELLLWGYNAIVLIIPVIDLYSFEDPIYREFVEKSRAIFGLAKRIGMKVGIIICPNQGLLSSPDAFSADPSFDPVGNVRGNAGRNLCPAKGGAVDYLKSIWSMMLRPYTDIGLDYIITWPYDEGGCGCETCRPWGANGYCDIVIKLHGEAIKYYPDAKFIVSAWTFDKPDDQCEFEGLYARLKGDMSWVDYIMVDAHAEFPQYPLDREVIKPIVNFPEISMWKLYPWGGYGANPLPARFHANQQRAKRVLSGGMPYSEGMYEDISKIQCVGYYWNAEGAWQDILAEYINYEYSFDVIDDVIEMISCIEENHVRVGESKEPVLDVALRAEVLARETDKRLGARAQAAWRWRILYIRAILDAKRYTYYAENGMHGTDDLINLRRIAANFLVNDVEAQACLKELFDLYHCVEWNGTNHHTLPVIDGKTHFGNLVAGDFRNKKK